MILVVLILILSASINTVPTPLFLKQKRYRYILFMCATGSWGAKQLFLNYTKYKVSIALKLSIFFFFFSRNSVENLRKNLTIFSRVIWDKKNDRTKKLLFYKINQNKSLRYIG